MKRVLIIDGNNLGWRGFGTAPLTHNGKRTEVVFIGLGMLRSYLVEFEPDQCIVVWDGGRDKRRLQAFPDYKRKKKKLTEVERRERDIFFTQMYDLINVFRHCGVLQYQLLQPPREADDVIYNLVLGDGIGLEYIVVSTDKDFYQLLGWGEAWDIKLYSPIRKKMITEKMIKEELGISVSWFVTYRAMVGDSSDNLPGVHGIGSARAKKLIMAVSIEDWQLNDRSAEVTKLLGVFNTDRFDLMFDLIKFKSIPNGELKRGQLQPPASSLPNLLESIMGICMKYGFERYSERFSSFIEPFEELWYRRRE